jgi:hypothetical protein
MSKPNEKILDLTDYGNAVASLESVLLGYASEKDGIGELF